MNARAKLLALIAQRDARDTLERASGWVVSCTHIETDAVRTLYGPFSEPASALVYAAELEAGLNIEGEEGFRCQVQAIMPVT